MTRTLSVLGSLWLLVAACSGDNVIGIAAPTPAPPAPIVIPAPANGFQVTMGPFSTNGTDVQLCRTLKLDNEEPVAINKLEVKMLAGSHHFILFRGHENADGTQVEYPDDVFDCKNTINFDEWDFVLDVNQAGGAEWDLGEGQAIVLHPHAQLLIQSHFVNSSVIKSAGAYSVFNMYATDINAVIHKVRGLFAVDTRIAIPPHKDNWTTKRRCSFSRTVNLVAMTGHFHQQGRTFIVNQIEQDGAEDDGELISQVYCSGPDCADAIGQAHGWDSPLFKEFPAPILVNGGSSEGLEFSCSYDNPTDNWIYFGGLAATQEHCNLFFQYYLNDESQGPLTCEEGSGGW